ncbi:MAG: 2-C-methyl-D-erythritol 2,4-cyclodiphosphate synthase [Dehalococcoidia bacterium]
MRVGQGMDIHRVDDSRTLVLGGVIIEEGPGLVGHSDADVLLHAITDAVLGAAGLGDIGGYFPSSDPRFAHADSADFLRKAVRLAKEAGWDVGNIDSTVMTQRPRLAPYVEHIRGRIAEIAGVKAAAVGVKAKTREGLDAVGRGEAMEAQAVVLLTSVEG